jgi:GNAT superfamily N-acetyltransferase
VVLVLTAQFIVDLWVNSVHRKKGYGRRLIEELENHFKGKGFNNINIVSCQFQAPQFYEKCGFTLEFVRGNIQVPELTVFFFVKYFDEVQTQGILPNKKKPL